MEKESRKKATVWILMGVWLLGISLFFSGSLLALLIMLQESVDPSNLGAAHFFPLLAIPYQIGAVVSLSVGLLYFGRAKGYSGLMGFMLGVTSFIHLLCGVAGLGIMLFLKDRRKVYGSLQE
ncbi:MAG: hypothetical protein MJA29_03155 [Candidatus Omnitrophica bacterium]|nr:hypothetical protein [Candidatus Omnitrophota bacterium]